MFVWCVLGVCGECLVVCVCACVCVRARVRVCEHVSVHPLI